MSRKKTVSGKKKIVVAVSAAALVGGIAVVMTGTSQASVTCDGLAKALANNQDFIAKQQANPDANSAAKIANREAVIKQIGVQQEAAGCSDAGGDAAAQGDDAASQEAGQEGADAQAGAEEGAEAGAGAEQGAEAGAAAGAEAGAEEGADAQAGADEQAGAAEGAEAQAGEVVCQGSTVTVSGEGGAPAASSGEFPVGTQLKVTNLDNDKSTTVEVKSTSGSCALLNNAAFEEVREAGKFLIRNARIEKVG
ncbi:hypothetical protein [Streptomyces sp. 8N706]|uniref:hypothetical protein n=1 Tax=Streptomyces sp. 8N706 TaxID=3457416 RepID=UPI003FCFA2F3